MYNISRAEGVYFKGDFSKRNKIFFEENLRLRGRKINYVWCILNSSSVSNVPAGAYIISEYQNQISAESLNGRDLSFTGDYALSTKRDTVAVNGFLTLVSNNKEIVRKIPITSIYESTMKGEPLQICDTIDFEKSFIECYTGSLGGGNKTLRAFFVFAEGKEYDVNSYNLDTIEVIEEGKTKNTPNATNISYKRCDFPDNEYLRGERFHEISIHDGMEYAGGVVSYQCYTPDAKNLMDKFTINHSLVTFVDGDSLDEVFYNIPLCCLSQRFTTHGPLFGFDKVKLNLKRSYVTDLSSSFVLDAAATTAKPAIYYFTVKLAKQ